MSPGENLRDLARRIDLAEVPLTIAGSRLFVLARGSALDIHEARYEVPLEDCRVATGLVVRDQDGGLRHWSVPDPCRICWGENGPWLTLTPEGGAVLGRLPRGWSVHLEAVEERTGLAVLQGQVVRTPDGGLVVRALSPGAGLVITPRTVATSAPADAQVAADEALREQVGHNLETVDAWMRRCPEVLAEHRSTARLCWWVLGVNTLRLGGAVTGRAVVPSKLGYVGLWQWDAYFIAIGLRHGDPELAAEQLRLALSCQQADGQLPDVVHEAGVLASSRDLPPADLASLRALGTAGAEDRPVPLTKPPLTALAIELVDACHPEDLITQMGPAVRRSQQWWFERCDPRCLGVPTYLHPYSSGLDDSPVFGAGTPIESPDLSAYLCLQDTILARWSARAGQEREAASHLERAERLRRRLEECGADRRFIPAVGPHGPSPSLTVVSLMPLLVPGLDHRTREAILALLDRPEDFGARGGGAAVPTVAPCDPAFDPQRMWRGPVWVNTNWLVARGLRTQGMERRARDLEAATLRLVTGAGGPVEYIDPVTGRRPTGASTCFGWSAALFIDLAVTARREATCAPGSS
ncbi:MAG: hypothetical protein Q4C85_01180 [Actinomyces sp.]|uniref:MGH1-like glycoside hydrolase domain-containing protein n=1 Tax=Actinomyces sp. TaxID=29317 RepID=UPI0026DB98CA|nr:hypothetical protein [Actinomyces sp.]MDO4242376.1 hypothetical protein [Actinomyces sp.]